jgi:hypothetical protein
MTLPRSHGEQHSARKLSPDDPDVKQALNSIAAMQKQ